MEKPKETYYYEGPVMQFDQCIESRWSSTTRAVSEKKAKSNLIFQYKQARNMSNDRSKIELPGKLTKVG